MSSLLGFDAEQARQFVRRHLEKSAGHTSFFWESEEVEDAVEVLVDAMAELIEANNRKVMDDTRTAAMLARYTM